MSSAKSPALNPADLHDALQTALIEVSENAYFVFVEPADHAQFADAVGLVKDAWLKVSVAFEGSFAGAVEIVMPEPLGMWLVTSLLGMQGHETLEEVAQFDGVGEFANMVCGAWLSRLSDRLPVRAACARRDENDRRLDAVVRQRPVGADLPDGDDQRVADADFDPGRTDAQKDSGRRRLEYGVDDGTHAAGQKCVRRGGRP